MGMKQLLSIALLLLSHLCSMEGACPARSATFCGVNANCISAVILNVTGPVTFAGPVTITYTGQATGCVGGTPALTVDGGEVVFGNLGVGGNADICGVVTVAGVRDELLLAKEGLRSFSGFQRVYGHV